MKLHEQQNAHALGQNIENRNWLSTTIHAVSEYPEHGQRTMGAVRAALFAASD
jgi:hypothetical protein